MAGGKEAIAEVLARQDATKLNGNGIENGSNVSEEVKAKVAKVFDILKAWVLCQITTLLWRI
jgi:hypothetical protein